MSAKKKQRMYRIKQMLLEMASGNFFYRLERSAKNDNLESISISLNMLAEEIQDALLHQGYVNSNRPIVETIQMCVVLDPKGHVEIANQQACSLLSVLHADIIGKPFNGFLTDKSQTAWQRAWNSLGQKGPHDTSLVLEFRSKIGLVVPKTCFISSFGDKNTGAHRTLLSVIHHAYAQDRLESGLNRDALKRPKGQKQPLGKPLTDPKKQKPRLSFEDVRKIRDGHNIIVNNLEMDFPSLKEFALQLGTNEFKLKYGFRELYGDTVFNFIKRERLQKSRMMVLHTTQSFKAIAQMTGFKSISHFSRTFKKQFGCSPSAFRKASRTNNE